MADDIEVGQIYRCAIPGLLDRRIRVVAYSPYSLRAQVVNADTGKNQRPLLVVMLHSDRFTESGQPRRTGYVLEVNADG